MELWTDLVHSHLLIDQFTVQCSWTLGDVDPDAAHSQPNINFLLVSIAFTPQQSRKLCWTVKIEKYRKLLFATEFHPQ